MTIALLCPTKGRVELCRRMIESAVKTAEDVKVYLAYSPEESGAYSSLSHIKGIPVYSLQTPDGMPTAHKWNILADVAMHDAGNKLFMLSADDMIFGTPLWDKALLEHYSALGNKAHVYHLQDSRDENGTPHVIVTREWIETMGWFVPPIFMHWMIDTWTVEIAKSCSVFTHMKDYLLIHDKPSDNGIADETHNGIRQRGWHQRDKWVAEHCGDWLKMQKHKLCAHVGRYALEVMK